MSALESSVPAKHFKSYVRRIWASCSVFGGLSVSYNSMEADGGTEMRTHDDQNHLFYVLEGEMRVSDGTSEQLLSRGSALVVKAGETHQVAGTGKMPCEYLLVTISTKRSEAV